MWYNECMNRYKSTAHAKHLLQYHIILVCKYRLNLLQDNHFDITIKSLINDCCVESGLVLHHIESDNNRIHLLIETIPNSNISRVVNKIKSYTTYHSWVHCFEYLNNFLWSTKSIWTRGYFVSTVGRVSATTVSEYIKNQGKE